ncbi:EthD family reductase [Arthrobacter sp. APC 3897]|uniref:EthD family reductase n=1 Tax=Arthrobacter sp. APC 3897 TaxID=3035204 RepID=UPI0025B3C732|nr:EthD family reductase [Arthrobacter sp. APC 3897]MDN3482712.1 EthD family reductase [Arthrobacter sp. APC 3897]
MYNLVIVSSKPPEWTHEEFIEWWRGPHAQATLKIPGLRSWRQIEIDRAFDKRSQDWDGVSMLSFDSSEAADAAFASQEWKDAVAQVGDMRGRRLAFLGEEIVRTPEDAAGKAGL